MSKETKLDLSKLETVYAFISKKAKGHTDRIISEHLQDNMRRLELLPMKYVAELCDPADFEMLISPLENTDLLTQSQVDVIVAVLSELTASELKQRVTTHVKSDEVVRELLSRNKERKLQHITPIHNPLIKAMGIWYSIRTQFIDSDLGLMTIRDADTPDIKSSKLNLNAKHLLRAYGVSEVVNKKLKHIINLTSLIVVRRFKYQPVESLLPFNRLTVTTEDLGNQITVTSTEDITVPNNTVTVIGLGIMGNGLSAINIDRTASANDGGVL